MLDMNHIDTNLERLEYFTNEAMASLSRLVDLKLLKPEDISHACHAIRQVVEKHKMLVKMIPESSDKNCPVAGV